jgi:cell division protein FtsB
MVKNKIKPRPLNTGVDSGPPNFIYRLVSSQRFLAIIGLVFLVVIIFPLARTYSQRRLIEKEITDVKNQISDFENQNQELKDLITYLQSDQSLEEQARLNLNLKKPGEGVIMIEDKNIKMNKVEAAPTSSNMNNFTKWWLYFLD